MQKKNEKSVFWTKKSEFVCMLPGNQKDNHCLESSAGTLEASRLV
jgi:hypothetical protein